MDLMAIEPTPQPAVVEPVPQRGSVAEPQSITATPTTGRKAPSRVAAAVPRTVAAISSRVAALPQRRDPFPLEATLEAEAEQLRFQKEEKAIRSYLDLVLQKLESQKRYPVGAERSGLNGRVVPAIYRALGRRGA